MCHYFLFLFFAHVNIMASHTLNYGSAYQVAFIKIYIAMMLLLFDFLTVGFKGGFVRPPTFWTNYTLFL
jgi:hypothetical protein